MDNIQADAIGEGQFLPRFDKPSRFRRENYDTLEVGSIQWVVKDLWPRSGVCFVAGQSMSGKSFWVLDKLGKVARGERILGRRSKKCGVVYVAAEGAQGARKRIKAIRDQTGPLGGAFEFIGQAPNLTDIEDIDALRAVLISARDAMHERGKRLGVVAIDTLSASIPGADENTAKDMSPVLTALQNIAVEMDLLVLFVAHTGKQADRSIRGWSGLLANADGVIMMDGKNDDDTFTGTVTKVKDGNSGDRFAFKLEQVVLGHDEDGEEETTCRVIEADFPIRQRMGTRPKPDEAAILSALSGCIVDRPSVSTQHPNGAPEGRQGVLRKALKIRLQEDGFRPHADKPDTVNKAINRAITGLAKQDRIGADDVCVWLLPK